MDKTQISTPPERVIVVLAILVGVLFVGVGMFWAASRPVSGIQAGNSNLGAKLEPSTLIEPLAAPSVFAVQGSPMLVPDPLPPFAVPLADALPELEARARDGDPNASCRLASEMQYCASLSANVDGHERWLAERESAFSKSSKIVDYDIARRVFEEELEQREKKLNWQADHCANVTIAKPQALIERWRRAAILRSPAAMRNYASGSIFEWSNLLDNAEQLMRFKREAPQMAITLAGWGDAPMNLALASAYSPYPPPYTARSLLSQAIRPSAPMSLALYKRLRRTMAAVDPVESIKAAGMAIDIEREIEHLETRMTDVERQQASDLLKELDLQWRPINPFLPANEDLYIGSQLPLRPRSGCGAVR